MASFTSEEQHDRVREYSPAAPTRNIDHSTLECLNQLADGNCEAITAHVDQLDREWDMERYLQTNASLLALAGIVFGVVKNRKFLLIPGIVFPFLLQHAVQGWCPPVPVFRRMGVRTRKEINREKYALKALRGDFSQPEGDADGRAS